LQFNAKVFERNACKEKSKFFQDIIVCNPRKKRLRKTVVRLTPMGRPAFKIAVQPHR